MKLTIKTKPFVRKPFDVQAVQITNDNMQEVSDWIGGRVVTPDIGRPFIQFKAGRGFENDWATSYSGQFRLYTRAAFARNFDSLEDATHDDGHPALIHRSAETGEFVTEDFAEENPSTTVSEQL